jgi:4-hydroxybenzoate polyprenyltransferase
MRNRGRFALYLDLIRWNRPAGWLVLLWPSLGGLWFAAEGWPGWHLLAVFVLGTILMRSAGCCINDVADRDFDRHVKRTATRPVTTGELSVREALAVGAVLALAYPVAKRFVSVPQAVLGIAFSFGIPMAFAATRGSLPPLGWWLLAGNLFWVLAYDTEYAMVDRDDDLRIGMKTSAITFGRFDVAIVMACYAVFLAVWAVLGTGAGLGAAFYLGIGAAAAQALWHWRLIRERTREGCFKAFRLNHWLGFTVFAGIVIDYALRQLPNS